MYIPSLITLTYQSRFRVQYNRAGRRVGPGRQGSGQPGGRQSAHGGQGSPQQQQMCIKVDERDRKHLDFNQLIWLLL